MIIEFVGLPGSGKTSIAAQLITKLKLAGRDVNFVSHMHTGWRANRFKRYSSFLCAGLSNPLSIYRLLRFAISMKPHNSHSFKRILSSVKFESYIEDSRGQILIFDQGRIQWFWSALLYTKDWDKVLLENILKRKNKKPDLVIMVETDTEICRERLEGRKTNYSRFEKLSGAELKNLLEKSHSKLLMLSNLYINYHQVPSLRLNGADDLDTNVQKILSGANFEY